MALSIKSTTREGFAGLVERHSDESLANTALTVTVAAGRMRQILLVTVKYSGAAMVSVTATLNSGAGASWDTLLDNTPLGGGTDFTYEPDEELVIAGDDAIDVLAPAVVGETSAVAVYTRVL